MSDKKKILIVDDEDAVREIFKAQLGEIYDLKEAYDGLSAISIIEEETPDLIISDLLMPTVTGCELIKDLKSNPEYKDIPLILITAAEYISRDSVDVDPADIIKKPFSMETVKNKIEEKLKQAQPSA